MIVVESVDEISQGKIKHVEVKGKERKGNSNLQQKRYSMQSTIDVVDIRMLYFR
jgi:hypothetical protein